MNDLLLKIKESLFVSEKDNKIVKYIIVNNMDFIEHIEPRFKKFTVNEIKPVFYLNTQASLYGVPLLRSINLKRGEFIKCYNDNPYYEPIFTNYKLKGFKINKD